MDGLYTSMAQRRLTDYDEITRAMARVKEYIIKKDFILYGGQAIDYVMRIKGDKVYDDGILPDFDFMSPDNVNNAYELGRILHEEGYTNISVIRARHIQTMRVRVDFVVVADCSHVPEDIFHKLPSLQYAGMRVMHPDQLRLDQHQSLSFPFIGPPTESMFNRWRKDITRFDMLDRHYPIGNTINNNIIVNEGVKVIRGGADPVSMMVPISSVPCGWTAYSILRGESTYKNGKVIGPLSVFEFASIDTTASLKGSTIINEYEPYMDIIPPFYDTVFGSTHAHIYNVDNKLTSVVRIDPTDPKKLVEFDPTDPFRDAVISTAFIMLQMLYSAQRNITSWNLVLPAYQWLLEQTKRKDVQETPYRLSVDCIGVLNYDTSFVLTECNLRDDIGDGVELPPRITNINLDISQAPNQYFPDRGDPPKQYEYDPSLYNRSGVIRRTEYPVSEGGNFLSNLNAS